MSLATCLICGEVGADIPVSNGPSDPIIGSVHDGCLEPHDPQIIEDNGYYDYPDFILNEIGERVL